MTELMDYRAFLLKIYNLFGRGKLYFLNDKRRSNIDNRTKCIINISGQNSGLI